MVPVDKSWLLPKQSQMNYEHNMQIYLSEIVLTIPGNSQIKEYLTVEMHSVGLKPRKQVGSTSNS